MNGENISVGLTGLNETIADLLGEIRRLTGINKCLSDALTTTDQILSDAASRGTRAKPTFKELNTIFDTVRTAATQAGLFGPVGTIRHATRFTPAALKQVLDGHTLVFEEFGPMGTGKTTRARNLARALANAGRDVVICDEQERDCLGGVQVFATVQDGAKDKAVAHYQELARQANEGREGQS